MKIKSDVSKKTNTATILIVLGIICLSFFLLQKNTKIKSTSQNTLESNQDIDTATSFETISYNTLFNTTDYELYSDADLSIYLIKASGITKMVYAYKKEVKERDLTDNFFLHIYVKDSTKLKGNAKFINVDFTQKPKIFNIEGNTYSVFQRDLTSSSYTENHIPINTIAFLNTGRFKSGEGRSLDLRKLTPKNTTNIELQNNLDFVTITIKQKGFEKIKAKRVDALNKGVLISEDNDLIPGIIQLGNEKSQKAELRLKGDWIDHLKHDKKWSYRIIMKGGNTFKGMRKFSLQHPVVRNYLWEWLFNKTVKDQGIIGLRYNFVNVALNVKDTSTVKIPMGIMAIEESFDKILIENNKKREGIILAFDESLLWKDREKQRILGLEDNSQSRELHSLSNAQIKVFNENKVLSDPKLLKQFKTAKDLLDGLREGNYKISDVFDIDRLATFLALTNLFGGGHGLIWHNLRIYYNPITNKLEPISFDSNSGSRIDRIMQYPMAKNDSVFQEKFLEKLALVSSTDFIKKLLASRADELEQLKISLYTEYNNDIDLNILVHNSNFIKKKINPAALITANLLSYDNTQMKVEINNISGYPITIENLSDIEARVLTTNKNSFHIKEKTSAIIDFTLSDYFINAFVSKKNKKGTFQYPKDVQKLNIIHHLPGVNIKRKAPLKPYGKNPDLDQSISYYKKGNEQNFHEFPFIEEQSENTLVFKEGTHTLTKDLIIPSGYTIKVSPGFLLDFKNDASLFSYSTFISNGNKEKLVKFYSSDSTGRGIFVSNATQKSQIHYTVFDNLSNPKSNIWEVSGAVNFHESDVIITHSSFSNNRCEDGLNIIRSSFTMTDTVFEGTQSDAFDGDFVTGTLERCTFLNAGNDGIDVSGSELAIKDIVIKNSADKAVSAGENSAISGENIKVIGGEIGVVSKDLSKIHLTNLSIIDTRLGLSAFQKKSEYGVASIEISKLTLENNELDYLIENRSSLIIDNIAVETVSNNVIDQMYGKEYGKSSR